MKTVYEPGGQVKARAPGWRYSLMLGGAPAPKPRIPKRYATEIICSLRFGWGHNAEPQPAGFDISGSEAVKLIKRVPQHSKLTTLPGFLVFRMRSMRRWSLWKRMATLHSLWPRPTQKFSLMGSNTNKLHTRPETLQTRLGLGRARHNTVLNNHNYQ